MKLGFYRRIQKGFKVLIHSRRFQSWMGKSLSMIQLMELDACTHCGMCTSVALWVSLLKRFPISIFSLLKSLLPSKHWLRADGSWNVRSGIFKRASTFAPIATVAQWFVR
jgi:hypothetical protein